MYRKRLRSNSQKTLAQRKRASANYREIYFRKNPGILGLVWFCAYCGKAMTDKKEIHVDHITPLNSAMGSNHRINTVSSCAACNLEKSDIIDTRILKGYGAKSIHSLLFFFQKILAILLIVGYYIILFGLRFISNVLVTPFKGTSYKVKLIFTGIYLFAGSMLLKKIGLL